MNGICSAFRVISKDPIVTVIVNWQREGPRAAQKGTSVLYFSKYSDSSILVSVFLLGKKKCFTGFARTDVS